MKSQFQDIIPPEKRSIRNISIEKGQVSTNMVEPIIDDTPIESVARPIQEIVERKIPKDMPIFSQEPHRENLTFTGARKITGVSKLVLWIFTCALVAALFFAVTYFLNSATIRITTKKFEVKLPSSLDIALKPVDNEVGYSSVTLTESITSKVTATGEKDASEKSHGTITIYNNYDSNAQKFTEGTRFETPTGLVFRLTKAIVVPGKKKVDGKNVAGSVEAEVIADAPGEKYNIGVSDFSIPGLKDDPRFTSFYARSKSPMNGGAVGKIAVVEEVVMTKAVSELKDALKAKLKDKLSKELPQNQIIFDGLSSFDFKVPNPKIEQGKAIVEVVATAKFFTLDSVTLSRLLLKGEDATVDKKDLLTIDTTKASSSVTYNASSTPSITLNGTVAIDFVLNKDDFKNSSLGLSEDEVIQIAKKYNAISSISTTIKPFWKKVVPTDTNKVSIIVK